MAAGLFILLQYKPHKLFIPVFNLPVNQQWRVTDQRFPFTDIAQAPVNARPDENPLKKKRRQCFTIMDASSERFNILCALEKTSV